MLNRVVRSRMKRSTRWRLSNSLRLIGTPIDHAQVTNWARGVTTYFASYLVRGAACADAASVNIRVASHAPPGTYARRGM